MTPQAAETRPHAQPAQLAGRLVAAAQRRGRLLVCTDFDGTLAPIVDRPDQAQPLAESAEALAWLSRGGAEEGAYALVASRVAVVTARDAADVAGRLRLGPEAMIAGNGGLELREGRRTRLVKGVSEWMGPLADAGRELEQRLAAGAVSGARLERKRCAVVLHTRGLPAAGDAEVEALASGVGDRFGLALHHGKRTFELRVPVRRDKAAAVTWAQRRGWRDAATCAAGDDAGDIGMLRLVSGQEQGLAVAVGGPETPSEVIAAATAVLAGPERWARMLSEVVERLRS